MFCIICLKLYSINLVDSKKLYKVTEDSMAAQWYSLA